MLVPVVRILAMDVLVLVFERVVNMLVLVPLAQVQPRRRRPSAFRRPIAVA